MPPLIEALDLKKSYGEETVLDIERLEVGSGEAVSVLGPSGAGKSVLLRILNLIEPATSGTLLFDGFDVDGLDRGARLELRRRMVLMFQDALLFKGTVLDNVEYGLKVRRVAAEERRAKAEEALSAVGLEGFGGKPSDELSGGEAHRVALARSLVLEPDILYLDEPFANLDPVNREALHREFADLIQNREITALFVTHDQEEAALVGDRIILLNGGRIVQEGASRDLFYNPDSEFAARFLGAENILDGVVRESGGGMSTLVVDGRDVELVADLAAGSLATFALRPEDVILAEPGSTEMRMSTRNVFTGRVVRIEERGPTARVTVECPFPLVSLITSRSLEGMGLREGSEVEARFKAVAAHVIGGRSA